MREDIKNALEKYKSVQGPYKLLYAPLEKHLTETEKVLYLSGTNVIINPEGDLNVKALKIKGGKPFLFIITNERVIFFNKFLMVEEFTAVPKREIRNVEFRKNLTGSTVRLFTLSKTYEFSIIYAKNLNEEITGLLNSLAVDKGESKIVQTSEADELRKFKKLFDDGIITEEEFNFKKNKLLGIE